MTPDCPAGPEDGRWAWAGEAIARLPHGPVLVRGPLAPGVPIGWGEIERIVNESRAPCVVALDDDRLEDATVDDLRQALEHGGTIHIERVGHWSPAVAGAEAALGRLLGGERVSANLYASPAGGRAAFGTHHDPHDVLVVQLAGRKRWEIFGPVVTDPLVGYPAVDYDAEPLLPVEDVVLGAGDALALRRGVPHRVTGVSGEPSLHLNFRILRLTGAALLKELVDRALALAEVRSACPPGEPAEQAAWSAAVLRAVQALWARTDPSEVLAVCRTAIGLTVPGRPLRFPADLFPEPGACPAAIGGRQSASPL